MNTGTIRYYVLTDDKNLVTGVVPSDTPNARYVDVPLSVISDLTSPDRMHLYTVDENHNLYEPSTQALELYNQVQTLKATADEQSATVDKLTEQLASSQKLITTLQLSFSQQLAKLQAAK